MSLTTGIRGARSPGGRWFVPVVAWAILAGQAQAQVSVEAVVTPLVASVRYDITVFNMSLEDLALVSLTDAPLGDPLIDPTLHTPPAYLGSYDSGLGFVDFLPVLDGFAAGTTVGGFGFESLSAPGQHFHTFEALGISGTPYSGTIRIVSDATIPEAHTLLIGAGLTGCLIRRVIRSRRRQP